MAGSIYRRYPYLGICLHNVKIMKSLGILKVISLSSVLMMAMAFSCQDHDVPDPVTRCNRVDGTPRAFPCEFEITRVDFLKKLTNDVAATILPGNLDFVLPLEQAYRFEFGSRREYAQVVFKVRIHVKRIATASFPVADGYEVWQYRVTPHGPPYFGIYNDDIGGPGGNAIPEPTNNSPIKMDMAVGETRTVDNEIAFVINYYPPQPKQIGDFYFAIMNNTTARKLASAPYNYGLLRDIDEGHIGYAPRAW